MLACNPPPCPYLPQFTVSLNHLSQLTELLLSTSFCTVLSAKGDRQMLCDTFLLFYFYFYWIEREDYVDYSYWKAFIVLTVM